MIVAPLAGAWIEILKEDLNKLNDGVAPLAGAWIEIIGIVYRPKFGGSLPSWERGLKSETDGISMLSDSRSPLGSEN